MFGNKTNLHTIIATMGITLLAGSASAAPISLVYNGTDVAPGDREIVTFSTAPVSQGTRAYAYGFNMSDVSTPSTLGDFMAWCLDIGSYLSTSSTAGRPYTTTDAPFSNSFGVTKSRIQSVFDANFASVDTSDGKQAAAFQVALWNMVYDDDADAGSGTFAVTADSGVMSLANDYLAEAASFTGDKAYRLTFLESTPGRYEKKYQNLVTIAPVPIPAAGGLLIMALGGLGFASRRRKSN
ncbi:VPLPA-CTERM sorting domain-containing protein [Maritimibacter dapengensis]|uniref:VPLPA-CTERM sorting domain-containing protein n=1 Tax=Maritimibacter dapengensis TaxID=2836868 RepID=UPI0021084984|nr:VPLPA-CTERM sorting domain-containing protein [Maritimibacter dapengensis]